MARFGVGLSGADEERPVGRARRSARVLRVLARRRGLVQASTDGLAWFVALLFTTWVRIDLANGRLHVYGLLVAALWAAVAQVVTGLAVGLYLGRYRFGTFEEFRALAKAVVGATLLLLALNAMVPLTRYPVPRSVPAGAAGAALVLMAGVRCLWRLFLERRKRPRADGCQRLVVFGAGEGAAQVVTAMLRDPRSPYVPVALVDDDPAKRRLRILGVPVLGTRAALGRIVEERRADALLIAIPSADSTLIAELLAHAAELGIPVKVLPPVGELLDHHVGVGDIRELTITDLVGRHAIDTDVAAVASYLTGKRVLVTGAGGSIGSELCRQISRFAPAELVMVDRDESALHALELSMEGAALLESSGLVLADLRDHDLVHALLAGTRPHVIFHAAALKHLTLLERHPAEGYKTNVVATRVLLEAAAAAGVERFVNVSTDKAADPTSVLGYTKRIAERLTAWYGSQSGGTFVSVRFGNVFGSRGSVLSTFAEQIRRGGPMTVTDPDVTRFLMSVEEAVELVIQAGALGRSGEVLVLDLGDPVRIDDLARLLAARARRPIDVTYTGLRPGEKLHEVLFGCHEEADRRVHPLIAHVGVPPLGPGDVDLGIHALRSSTEAVRDSLARLCEDALDPTAVP